MLESVRLIMKVSIIAFTDNGMEIAYILSNSLSSANPSKETFQRAQKDSFTYYNNLKFGLGSLA